MIPTYEIAVMVRNLMSERDINGIDTRSVTSGQGCMFLMPRSSTPFFVKRSRARINRSWLK